MFKLNFCFHKWMYIVKPYTDTFLGEEITKYYEKFRICKKCGKAQEQRYGYFESYWRDLSKEETEVLIRKVKEGKFIIKK